MFVPMKKILCLLTVLLMCAVSYGATTVTAEKQETKVLVIGHGNDFAQVAKAFLDFGSLHVVVAEEMEKLRQEVEDFNFNFENTYLNFDYVPILYAENPKHFYKGFDKPIKSKAILNKANHFRKSRDAI